MTEQYQKRNINNGQNFFFREFQVGDPTGAFLFPFQQLTVETQLATLDTRNIAGIVLLPSARAAGPNAEITIVAANASSNPLTITTTIPGDTFVVPASIILFLATDDAATIFKSNGADNWLAVSQNL